MGTKTFDAFITKNIPDVQLCGNGQYFPLYLYKDKELGDSLFGAEDSDEKGYAISSYSLNSFKNKYGNHVTQEDIFYYVYGILWNSSYLSTYSSNLRKELPRIPYSDNFHDICKAGRRLAELHLNFETCKMYDLKITAKKDLDLNKIIVKKMNWDKKAEKPSILINGDIRIEGFPEGLMEFLINGRNPIDWLVDRFQVKKDVNSGIVNDPNVEIERLGGILATLKRVSFVVAESQLVVKNMPPI
jgi:predicted helicase